MDSPTSDYVNYFLNLERFSPDAVLTIFFLGLFRIAPIVSLAPFFGAKLPGGVKMGLAITLTIIFVPELIQTSKGTFAFDMAFIAFGFKELLMGFILGFLATIPFYIAQGAGSLIDFMRGASSLQTQDPMMRAQTSVIGVMFNYFLIIIFFEIGGPFYFLDVLHPSREQLFPIL